MEVPTQASIKANRYNIDIYIQIYIKWRRVLFLFLCWNMNCLRLNVQEGNDQFCTFSKVVLVCTYKIDNIYDKDVCYKVQCSHSSFLTHIFRFYLLFFMISEIAFYISIKEAICRLQNKCSSSFTTQHFHVSLRTEIASKGPYEPRFMIRQSFSKSVCEHTVFIDQTKRKIPAIFWV